MTLAHAKRVAEDGITNIPYRIPVGAGSFAPECQPVPIIAALVNGNDALEQRVARIEGRGKGAGCNRHTRGGLVDEQVLQDAGRKHSIPNTGGGDE